VPAVLGVPSVDALAGASWGGLRAVGKHMLSKISRWNLQQQMAMQRFDLISVKDIFNFVLYLKNFECK
jgi:hypothetical protein